MRNRRQVCCLLLLVSMLVLVGCNGSHETDQLAYIVALGLDKGENNKIIATYQIAIPRQVGGTSTGDEDSSKSGEEAKKGFVNITIAGFSFAETRNELKSIVALIPEMYHTKIIIFGEELAKSNVGDAIGVLARLRDFRGTMYVAVAKGSAQNFLEQNKPAITNSTAKYYELMMQSDRLSGFFLANSMHNFYKRLKGHGGDNYAAYIGSNPNVKADKLPSDPAKKPHGDTEVPRKAGEINRVGGNNPSEFLGVAVFNGDQLAGVLDSHQSRMMSIFYNNVDSAYLTVEDIHPEAEKKPVSLRYKVQEKPEVETQIVDGIPVAHIHLKIEGELTSIASGVNYEAPEYREKLENRLSELFTQDLQGLIQTLQGLDSDALSIGDFFRPRFSTMPEFVDFDWKGKFKDAQIDGDVQFKIRRTGLLWKSNPIEE